ncbi:MAG: hypothetical protein QOD08_811 [Gaiellaceae bacterium]|nr:hypothetical protein [Gaiellaceae bacterium]
MGLTVAFVVAPSATGTPNQDTTPPTSPDPPPPAPDPAPVPKPAPKPTPAPKPAPAPTPKPTPVQPAPSRAPTNAPTYTPPATTSAPQSSAVVKTKRVTHKVKRKSARKKPPASGVLAANATRVRDVRAIVPLAPPALVASTPAGGALGAAVIFVTALMGIAVLLIGFVAVPMTFIRSRALAHVRWAYGSGIGTVGCALLLIALATLALSHGGR